MKEGSLSVQLYHAPLHFPRAHLNECTFIGAEAGMVPIGIKYSIEWDPVLGCENRGTDRLRDLRRISVWLHSSVSVGDYEKLENEKTKSLRESRTAIPPTPLSLPLSLCFNNKLPLSIGTIDCSALASNLDLTGQTRTRPSEFSRESPREIYRDPKLVWRLWRSCGGN